MKLRLYLCLLLTLPFLTAHGYPIGNNDTLQIPDKIMNIPTTIVNEGDRAGAWGLPTLIALRYGLTVDETRDDRLDKEASEKAALSYLTDLYAEFGNWDLCYYAYLYSPAYVRNLLMRKLSIPQPKPVIKKTVAPKPAPKVSKEKPKQQPKFITYTVKAGDTLSKIAKKHDVKVSDIKKWNNLKSDLIREKQKLKIYQ